MLEPMGTAKSAVSSSSRPSVKKLFIATTNGRAYYTFVTLLTNLGLKHKDLLPGQMTDAPDLLLTTRNELPEGYTGERLLYDDLTGEKDLDSLLLISKLYKERVDSLVIGVDPGGVTGIAILYKGTVTFRTFADAGSAVDYIRRVLGFIAASKTVRLGTGDRRYVHFLSDLQEVRGVTLELVDESGTTSKGRAMKGGQRDAIAALHIARRRGKQPKS